MLGGVWKGEVGWMGWRRLLELRRPRIGSVRLGFIFGPPSRLLPKINQKNTVLINVLLCFVVSTNQRRGISVYKA